MRVLRWIWKLLVGIKDALVLLLLLCFFGLLFAALNTRPNPALARSGALVIKFEGALVEQPADADTLSLVSGSAPADKELRLRDVIRALHSAATDSAVKSVVLDLDRYAGGAPAATAAVAEAIDGVRRANKPVLAYATGYIDSDYLIAAHASEVWLDPMGAVLLEGYGRPQLYYKGLLDKLGVTAHLYRAGKYKSYGEPYILTHASPEAKEADQALVDSLWTVWLDNVKRARPQAKLTDYLADPASVIVPAGSNAAGALKAGLVDKIGDRIAFGKRVAELSGDAAKPRPGDYAAMPIANYLAAHAEPAAGAVGVLTIAGDIVDGERGPGTAGGDTIARLLLDELQKKDIKALVVRIDSPGGSVTASERIRSAILEAKARGLPVVVSMGSVAASGGYWVATPAEKIYAEPQTITGSIGVFGILPTFEGSLAKLGLSADGVGTTPLSGQPDVYRGVSPQFARLMQASIDDIYRRFTGLVAQSRHLPQAKVDDIAQGRVWAGGTSRQLGLVDQFGGLDDAIAFAAGRAGLSEAESRPRWIEREPNSLKALLKSLFHAGGDEPSSAALDPMTRIARQPQDAIGGALSEVMTLLQGSAVQARCLECGGFQPLPPTDSRVTDRLLMAGAKL
ncbi:protease-4 [Sphingomonas vulcanisoli]|uniref:Protease-4 n=1 Tax=Sphingomonas vulcanisoli TaxID=1658060 RepID=A0ABX0TTM7_9SPHN|nr:signal peptide peptidase SppA [Sphingomonas vulcanisoli]NIJ08811.1 protease-4 [Sphingomonas vulcanisoli]